VDSIWARIAPDNIKAAEELVDRFAAVFEMLVQNPQAGRARPDLGPNLRSFAVGKLRHILSSAVRWHRHRSRHAWPARHRPG
jgi:plasmid stabilization system protein ParE